MILVSAEFLLFWSAARMLVSVVMVVMVSLLLRLRVRRHDHLGLVPNFLRRSESRSISGPTRGRRVTSASAAADVMERSGLWRFPEERTKTGRLISFGSTFKHAHIVADVIRRCCCCRWCCCCCFGFIFEFRFFPFLPLALTHRFPRSQVVLVEGQIQLNLSDLLTFKCGWIS